MANASRRLSPALLFKSKSSSPSFHPFPSPHPPPPCYLPFSPSLSEFGWPSCGNQPSSAFTSWAFRREVPWPFNTFSSGNAMSVWLRNFAKAKKTRADEDSCPAVDIFPKVRETALALMQASLDALSRELAKLRTGRASTGMLDHVIVVDSQGVRSPLNHVAAVSVLDQQTLRVMPYDTSIVKEIEKGIRSSPLQLNPVYEGTSFTVILPKPTKESIEAITKLIGKAGEAAKLSIRRARQNGMDSIKKSSGSMSKDDVKRYEKEVDEMTKKYVKSVDDTCQAKEKELTFF